MDENLAISVFRPHLKVLRTSGLFQLDPRTTPRSTFLLHQAFMRFSLLVPLVYASQEVVYMYQVRSDTDKVIDSMYLFLSFVASVYKQVILWLYADEVEGLMDIVKGPLFNRDDERQKTILRDLARRAKFIHNWAFGLTQVTCVLWTLKSMVMHLSGSEVDFAIWLPFDHNHRTYFYFVLFYYWLVTSWLGCNDCNADLFASALLAQCMYQLSYLRIDLETLVETSKEKALKEGRVFDDVFQEKFKMLLLHYNEIIRLAKGMEYIFGGSIFCLFLVTGWIFCTSTYRCVNINPMSIDFASMVSYMICVLIEIALYCYFGNGLSYEVIPHCSWLVPPQSEQLLYSAYNMDWLQLDTRHRRSLLIFMERVKRPVHTMAGTIIPLSAGTFLSILRSSYTFYAVLKTTSVSEHI